MLAELSDTGVFSVWVASVLGSAIAVIVVVWLIWGITKSALTIDEYADGVIVTALRILDNTAPLAAVETTVAVGVDLLNTVRGIEAGGAAILATAAAGPGGGR
ncbi:MAG TPA: hypothetical protein VH134_15920 [Candidatus Dormibacteraeota bacterium]|nr:hypothetical protein [Candidatus Dormibacteraeota bacterium]